MYKLRPLLVGPPPGALQNITIWCQPKPGPFRFQSETMAAVNHNSAAVGLIYAPRRASSTGEVADTQCYGLRRHIVTG